MLTHTDNVAFKQQQFIPQRVENLIKRNTCVYMYVLTADNICINAGMINANKNKMINHSIPFSLFTSLIESLKENVVGGQIGWKNS